MAAVGLDLLAQVADVGIDDTFVAFEVVVADPVDQFVAGEDPTGIGSQCPQQLPLRRGEVNGMSADGGLSSWLVQDQLAVAVGRDLVGDVVGVESAQDRANPKCHLSWAEWFGDVVVRAEFEAADSFVGVVSGGEDQDGDRGEGADLTHDFLSGDIGQPEVQDEQVWGGLSRQADRLGAGPGAQHGQTVVFEVGAQQVTDLPLVFDDQDAGVYRLPPT